MQRQAVGRMLAVPADAESEFRMTPAPSTLDIPIFPLNTVLFPAGRLPLRIFEVRYVDMTKACIRDDSVFGVCLIREGREAGEPAVPYTLGCTARIVKWEVQGAGLFSLVTEGEQVFRILESRRQRDGLLRAHVELVEPMPSFALAEAHANLSGFVGELVEKVGAENFSTPVRLDDAVWGVFPLDEVPALDD